MGEFFTKLEISRKVGVSKHWLVYWLKRWGLEETLRIGRTGVYDAEKVCKIQEMVEAVKKVRAFKKTS